MSDLETRIQNILDVYRKTRDELDALKAELEPQLEAAKEALEGLMVEYEAETGNAKFEDDFGNVQLIHESVSPRYDARSLDKLLDEYPFLREARKETTRKQHVRVK